VMCGLGEGSLYLRQLGLKQPLELQFREKHHEIGF
jgi:hypothetical protein